MRRLFSLSLLIAIIFAPTAHAGAWLQPEGHGLWIAQATYFHNAHFFDADGTRQSQPHFTKYEFQPYAEYGLRPNLTIGGTAYLQQNRQSGSEKIGVADPEFFARTRLWYDDRQVLSLQPLIKLPSAYRSDASPRSGTDNFDAELSLLYGRNLTLFSDRDYLDLRAGYRARGGALSDQWRADAALGLRLSDRWQVIPAIRMILAAEVPDNVAFRETGDLDYDLTKAEVTAMYTLNEKQNLHLTYFSHVAGRQTGNGYGITAGFSQDF